MAAMDKEARDARNAYRREYYRTHKDRIIATQERYWHRKAEQMRKEDAVAAKEGAQE